MKRLLTQLSPANAIALYAFLIYTTQRQGTQKVYATESFIARGLKWSRSKVGMVKRQLRDMGLVESFARRDDKGKVAKHYLLVRFAANCPDAKNPDAKNPTGGEIGGKMLCDRSSNAADVNGNTVDTRSKEDSGFTAVGASSKSAVESKATAGNKPSVPAVWKPDARPQWAKLAMLKPPRDFPSEREFDEHLDSAGLYFVPTYRSDLYRELCERKWRDWNERLLKWEPIRDWKKYVAALDEKMWDTLGSGRKTDAAAPEIRSAAAPAVVHHAAVAESPRVVAPATAARPVVPAIAPAAKPAEITQATACFAPAVAPRPAYVEQQPVEGDEIPAELEPAL